MANDDVIAGKVRQMKGKANNIAGAITGNTARQIKGKVQEAAGKAQEAIGKAANKKADENRRNSER